MTENGPTDFRDPREREVAELSDEIRHLTDQRALRATRRRRLMLDLNRERISTYQRLVALTRTGVAWVAGELARARRETGTAPMPQEDRRAVSG